MNLNIATVSFSIAVLGLVAAFNIIPGAGPSGGVAMLVIAGVLLMSQLIGPNCFGLRRQGPP